MPWLQVRLAISPEQAETYEDAFLEVGAVSVTFMDAEDQPIFEPELNTTPLWSHTHLLALFEDGTDADAVLAHMELLTGGPLPEHHSEVIEDQDWERSWMDNFQPMRFGQRLWIVPSWHAAPEQDAVNLLLDPGLAFGTGQQAQVRQCQFGIGVGFKQCQQVGVRPQRGGVQLRLENRLVFGVHEGHRHGAHFEERVFIGFGLFWADGETDLQPRHGGHL